MSQKSLSVCVCVCVLSHVRLFVSPWTVARQGPLSTCCHFLLQGDLPNPGIKPTSLTSALAGRFFFFLSTVPPGKPSEICSKN